MTNNTALKLQSCRRLKCHNHLKLLNLARLDFYFSPSMKFIIQNYFVEIYEIANFTPRGF